jgi:hypothetical protein
MTSKRSTQEEKNLDKGLEKLLGKSKRDYPPRDWKSLRENFRLELLYAGKHVVFRDRWAGEKDNLRLLERRVLFCSASADEARDWLDKELENAAPHEQCNLGLTFVETAKAPRRGEHRK